MAANSNGGGGALNQCNHCKKKSSPSLRIRACTRCYAVGYCSRDCQKAEWRKHKLTCKPRPRTKNETTIKQQLPSTQASCEEVIDINSDQVRLQTKNENGTWQDVGPINLLNANTIKVQGNTNSSLSRRKELSAATKRILGKTANSFIFRHSHDNIDENLIIFLHGAGDNHVPFDKLGQSMKLPQTATLSLSASMKMELPDTSRQSNSSTTFIELPFGLGFTWFEEMDYQLTGDVLANDHPRRLNSLGCATSAMVVLLSSLTDKFAPESSYWIPERVFLFGFSAGACLAMESCRLWRSQRRVPLGGAICIGGGIKTESLPGYVAANSCCDDEKHKCTDVLLITGSNDTVFSHKQALISKCFYDSTKVQIYNKHGKGHGMIESREEMQIVMEFLSKRLVRRMPSMEDMSEN